jgi:hypothetical protein
MAGRGAVPAGFDTQSRHSGGVGAPPGTTRSSCQELADEAEPEIDPDSVEKARPGAVVRTPRSGAPRGARRGPKRIAEP